MSYIKGRMAGMFLKKKKGTDANPLMRKKTVLVKETDISKTDSEFDWRDRLK